jgi:hypothetical protein
MAEQAGETWDDMMLVSDTAEIKSDADLGADLVKLWTAHYCLFHN